MKVLIVGGYGFIGSFVAERFFKEGHQVSILDNLRSGNQKHVTFKHKSYLMSMDDPNCENVFKLNKFDIVINLAVHHSSIISSSGEEVLTNTKEYIVGLVNLLTLSQKYKVERFIYASSTDVFAKNKGTITEDSSCNPTNPIGVHTRVGEIYCESWSKNHQLPITILRLAEVYGPKKQTSAHSDWITSLISQMLEGKTSIRTNPPERKDYIYVEDVADAFYRSALLELDGTYNLTAGKNIATEQVISAFKDKGIQIDLEQEDVSSEDEMIIDNNRIKKDLDWVPIYSIQEGTLKTLEWYQSEETVLKVYTASGTKNEKMIGATPSTRPDSGQDKLVRYFKQALPFIEILVFFAIMLVLNTFLKNEYENLDMTLLFIIFAILFLGRSHSTFIMVLGISWFIYDELAMGREMVALISNISFLATIAIYLLVGLTLGYMIDRKDKIIIETKDRLDVQQGKYEFLHNIYEETREVKDELQNRIVYSEDSFNKISGIVSKLDALEPQEIFSSAITVFEEIMKTEQVAIYTMNEENTFLRLTAKSLKVKEGVPNWIDVSKDSVLQELLSTKKLYVNKDFQSNKPILMAPVLLDNQITAVVCLYQAEFKSLTLHYQNLFLTLMGLVSSAINRANEYVFATNHERYVKGTKILQSQYFERIIQNKQKEWEIHGMEYTVLRIEQPKNEQELARQLESIQSSVRDSDFIGYSHDGELQVILSNTNEQAAKVAIQRLNHKQVMVH